MTTYRFSIVWLSVAYLLVSAAMEPNVAGARDDGTIGLSGKNSGTFCSNCHGGGEDPTVTFSGPTVVAPGAIATFAFTVRSGAPLSQLYAGLNLAASDGTLSVPSGQGLRIELGEVTHSEPKPNDVSGQATFEFQWQAPSSPGVYTLFGSGVSANGDVRRTGDGAERTTMEVFVGVATPTPSAPLPTATATATATPEAVACVGDCNGDGEVTVDEVIIGVNIALGVTSAGVCPAFDPSGDGQVTVDEVLLAVNRALTGCTAP